MSTGRNTIPPHNRPNSSTLVFLITTKSMNRILTLLSFALTILAIGPIQAQTSEQEIIDNFFEKYSDDPIEALDYLYGTTKWVDADGDGVKQLKSQLRQYQEVVGAYHGEEFLYAGRIGESFSTFVYFVKYERQPIRFTFEFYKPSDKWILFSFK